MNQEPNFFIDLKQLLSGNYSSLINFVTFSSNDIHFFILGRTYNLSNEEIFKNYLQNGINSLKTIDGDFLIVIIDNKKIMFFRDRHGAGKQVFYSDKYFSSQLSLFKAKSDFTPKPNLEGLFTFLSIGYIPSPQTSLEGVNKLPAGCVLTVENNQFKLNDLFDFDDFINHSGTSKLSIEDAAMEYERLHQKAIEDRIRNTEKVGLLLSGGYDSGGNISKLRDVYQGKVVSFSIGFKDNPWTELPLAKILADRYQSTHYDYEIDGSEIMDLPLIIKSLGDPFQEGGLMLNYSAMRLVQQTNEKPQIILGGDGNDQHFGTSGKELALHWKFKSNNIQFFQKLYDKMGNMGPFDNDNLLFRTQFHNRKVLHIQQSDIFGFTPYQLNKLNSINYRVPEFSYLKNSPRHYENFDFFFYCRNYLIDIKQVINEVILFKASKMADLFENNISFPYMSTDLYNFLKQMPVGHKFYGNIDELSKGAGKSKNLHKLYLKPRLPEEITNRKKQGGFAPLPIFLKNNAQRKLISDYIIQSDAVKQLFDKEKIKLLLAKYDKLAHNNGYWFWYQQVQANKIINLLTLVVWWDIYINNKMEEKSIKDLF